jgi:hypothetical protein
VDIRGFWAGCSKTSEIIPSSTANHTNRAERCSNAAARRPAAFLFFGQIGRDLNLAFFGHFLLEGDFCSDVSDRILLDCTWIGRKLDGTRRPRLYR